MPLASGAQTKDVTRLVVLVKRIRSTGPAMSTMPSCVVPLRNATWLASGQIFASRWGMDELVIGTNCETAALVRPTIADSVVWMVRIGIRSRDLVDNGRYVT